GRTTGDRSAGCDARDGQLAKAVAHDHAAAPGIGLGIGDDAGVAEIDDADAGGAARQPPEAEAAILFALHVPVGLVEGENRVAGRANTVAEEGATEDAAGTREPVVVD